ncbi:hypothetical protein M885DRAFT_520591 [Pelagophyceae sp. CCMP2097]|nr:hypothetical protein M885DRAFT_520591 [Pelagophyceae sp. CCMP2097]
MNPLHVVNAFGPRRSDSLSIYRSAGAASRGLRAPAPGVRQALVQKRGWAYVLILRGRDAATASRGALSRTWTICDGDGVAVATVAGRAGNAADERIYEFRDPPQDGPRPPQDAPQDALGALIVSSPRGTKLPAVLRLHVPPPQTLRRRTTGDDHNRLGVHRVSDDRLGEDRRDGIDEGTSLVRDADRVDDDHASDDIREDRRDCVDSRSFVSRPPSYGADGSLVLPFRPELRVIASTKNVQLVDSEQRPVLQLGRLGPADYVLEFANPLSPLTALCVALTRMLH